MTKIHRSTLRNPGRRAFLVLGGLFAAGYFISKVGIGKKSGEQSVSADQAAPADPYTITVDSTEVKIGSGEF